MIARFVLLFSGLVLLVRGSYVPQAGVSHGAPVSALPQGRLIVQPHGSVANSHGGLSSPVGPRAVRSGLAAPRRQATVSYNRSPAIPVALASPHSLTGGLSAPRRQAPIVYSRPTAILSALPANPRPLAATRRQSTVSYNQPASIGVAASVHGHPVTGGVAPIRQTLGVSASGNANPHQYRHIIKTPH